MALILIVDDSPTEVFVMQKALEKHGFKTAAAENGEEGVRKAKAMKPDLIFMDIVMPGVNGYQATRMLINDPETSLIPIGQSPACAACAIVRSNCSKNSRNAAAP